MKRLLTLFLFVSLMAPVSLWASSIPTVTKDELKAMLDSPDLVLLDVRLGRDWSSSQFKIKGADRLAKNDIDAALNSYDKQKTVVLYCA